MSDFETRNADDFVQLGHLKRYLKGIDGFIAGGAFKNIFEGQKVKDIDIFFSSQAAWLKAVKKFHKRKYVQAYENARVIAFIDPITKTRLELIGCDVDDEHPQSDLPVTFAPPEETIANFDFTVAKFALYRYGDNWMVVHHVKFFEHLKLKRLVIDADMVKPHEKGKQMPTLHLTRGIVASGKSTFAIEWYKESPTTRALSNRDDLRASMFPDNPGILGHEGEKLITKTQHAQISAALNSGLDVMIHDTNLRAANVKELMRLSDDVEFHDFPIDLYEAKLRNAQRAVNGGRFVPESVIESMYQRFTPKGKLPPVPERHDKADMVFQPYVFDPKLRSAVIFDIDGTLASHEGVRHPHDTTKYLDDNLHHDIAGLHKLLVERGFPILIVSGRDEAYRDVLVQWLAKHGIYWDEIHMRPEGDTREDSIIKNELYETKIKGRYNIRYIFDDRSRVIRMWRAKGMRVLQVADGEF